MFGFLSKLFRKKKTSDEIEDELSEQIIRENEESIQEAYDNDVIPASVITYVVDDSEDPPVTHPVVLAENFICKMFPQEGSIIWITIDSRLQPFVCIRYDFIQTDDMVDSMRVYIVVKKASSQDIIRF